MFGLIASFVMGMLLGLMGGGGSILTVPIMVYLFAVSPVVATGYSLFVVGITALVGSIMSARKREVDFNTAIYFAVPSLLGVLVSRSFLIPAIPEQIFTARNLTLTKDALIMMTFALVMIAASYSMIRGRQKLRPQNVNPSVRLRNISLQGLAIGAIAGFVGAGGGFLIVPALVVWAGLTMRVAIGTSLTVIAFQSLMGFAAELSVESQVDWGLLTSVAIIAIFGLIAGTLLAQKIMEQKLKMAFGWFVLITGAVILIDQLRNIGKT